MKKVTMFATDQVRTIPNTLARLYNEMRIAEIVTKKYFFDDYICMSESRDYLEETGKKPSEIGLMTCECGQKHLGYTCDTLEENLWCIECEDCYNKADKEQKGC